MNRSMSPLCQRCQKHPADPSNDLGLCLNCNAAHHTEKTERFMESQEPGIRAVQEWEKLRDRLREQDEEGEEWKREAH